MVKEIPLTQGLVALVDDDDYEWLMKLHKWHAAKYRNFCYAAYTVNRPSENMKSRQTSKKVFMHRLILNAKDGEICDHINGDTLDDRRCNLRIVTSSQNIRNSKKISRKKPCSSRYKGVCWAKKSNKWWVTIKTDTGVVNCGYFKNEEDAARAYNIAAQKYFGEYARLNVIPDADDRQPFISEETP